MPSINDRIGTKNVIRVLSNAAAPPLKLNFLNDIVSDNKESKDGQLLVWDAVTEKYYLTNIIDSSVLVATGVVTFTNTQQSTSTSTGSFVLNGGAGIAKNLNVGGNFSLGQNLFVTGLSTFSNDVLINNDLSVSGLSTFTETTNNILGNPDTGALQIDGGVGINKNLTVGGGFYVQGASEFIGVATFRGGTINIGDSVGDDINIGGEFVSSLVPNDDALYSLGAPGKRWKDGYFSDLVKTKNLYVTGVSTFTSNLDINASIDLSTNLTVDGLTDLDELNVAGIATFASNVDVNASVDISTNLTVDRLTDLNELNVTGLSTFASDLDVNASVDISTNLTVDGLTDLDELNVAGIATFNSEVYIDNSASVSGIVTITNDTDNILGNPDTGALQIDGGVGVNKNLTVGSNLQVIGLTTSKNLNISGISTFNGNLDINNSNVNVTGFVTVTEGLYYDSNDYDGPNGIAYFDNTGKLIGAASTENALTETYFILTTNAVGIPTWTSVIDGGQY